MRIALVVHQYLPEHVGGTEVYTHSLAEALTRQGHSVTVFFPDAAVNDDSQETIDAHMAWRAPASPPFGPLGPLGQFWRTFRNPETERSYRRMLAQIDPEIVHVQHVQNTSVRLLALSGARAVFLTLHDYWYRCAQGQLDYVDHSVCQGPSGACAECARARSSRPLPVALRPAIALPMAYRNAYITWMLTFVERFIAPSHHVRDQYVRWGMDAGRITVLPNGVDLERLRSHGAGISEPSARTLRSATPTRESPQRMR